MHLKQHHGFLLAFFGLCTLTSSADNLLSETVKLWIEDWKLCGGVDGRTPLSPIFSERANQAPKFRLSRRHRLCFWTTLAGNLAAAQTLKSEPVTIVHEWLKNVGGDWGRYRTLSAGRVTKPEAMVWEAVSEKGYFDWRTDTNITTPEAGYYLVAVGVRLGHNNELQKLTQFEIEVTD